MGTVVYVDTWYLVAAGSDKRREKSDGDRQFYKLRSNVFDVFVPQIALGEAVSVIVRDYPDPGDACGRLSKMYDAVTSVLDPQSCLPPPTMEALKYVQEMKQNDRRLDVTDMLIAAQALADPESQILLTRDNILQHSWAIRDMEKRLRDEGERAERLRIVDGI